MYFFYLITSLLPCIKMLTVCNRIILIEIIALLFCQQGHLVRKFKQKCYFFKFSANFRKIHRYEQTVAYKKTGKQNLFYHSNFYSYHVGTTNLNGFYYRKVTNRSVFIAFANRFQVFATLVID